MRVVALLLLVALVAGDHHHNDDLPHREKDVLGLLYKIVEPIRARFPNLKEASKSYIPSRNPENYKDHGVAATLLDDEIGFNNVLARKHIFSLFNDRHREEALMIFDVLMNSNDWNVLVSSASFYRERMNEGAFVYAIYVTAQHSPLAKGIVLPPLYEVTPHMFTNSEIVQQAYSAKMTQTPGKFRMDFTGSKRNPEQRVAYFGEDIGMNVHHVSWHMEFPFWWDNKYGYDLDRKGELFFWMHHQLTARFDSERLSNNLNMVDELYWDRPIVEGFAPHTTYRYGGEFPARPDNVRFSDVDGVARIRDMIIMESRIRDAIAHGYITAHDGSTIDIRNEGGIDILGDVIESSTYSPNPEYYGALHNLAHMILGRQGDPQGKYNQPPGVMEHFETATRDPSFFRLHKYMDNIFKEHKDSLPAYTREEVAFDGVSIDSVTLDGQLVTFFEDFEFDLSFGVDDTPEIADVALSAIVSRLNHEEFTVNYNLINNGDEHLATIRSFLCPRKDANNIIFSMDEGRWNCIEVDKFWRTLTPGANAIHRKSNEVSSTVPDIPSFNTLLATTERALAGEAADYSRFERTCGIPNRMLLPKGSTSGIEFVFFVAVTDGAKDLGGTSVEDKVGGSHTLCGVQGETYPDKRAFGYPLDRRIPDARSMLALPNMSKTTVVVHHRA